MLPATRRILTAATGCHQLYGVTGVCSVVTGIPAVTVWPARSLLGLVALVAATPTRIRATTAMLQYFMGLLR